MNFFLSRCIYSACTSICIMCVYTYQNIIYVRFYFYINSVLPFFPFFPVFPLQFCLMKQNGILILQKDIPLKGHLHVGCQNTYCCDALCVIFFFYI